MDNKDPGFTVTSEQFEIGDCTEETERLHQAVEAGLLPLDESLRDRAHRLKAQWEAVIWMYRHSRSSVFRSPTAYWRPRPGCRTKLKCDPPCSGTARVASETPAPNSAKGVRRVPVKTLYFTKTLRLKTLAVCDCHTAR